MRIDEVLVEAAHRHGQLTTRQVATAAGVSPATARQWLNWLVEEGRLLAIGNRSSRIYAPAERKRRQ